MSAWSDLAAAWWSWLAPAAWHATWVGLAAAGLERALARRAAPAYRAALWWIFFACFALPAGLASPLALGTRELAARAARLDLARDDGASLASALACLWLAGVAAMLLRLALVHARGARALRARSRPAPAALARELARLAAHAGVRARLELRLARGLASPTLAGILRAKVHLPEGLRPREREHALRHELAHAARRDPLRALAVELLVALLWFHPLAWLAARRLACLRELACDARVAALLGARTDLYRAALARAALRRVDARALGALGFLGLGGGARVVERLRALERPARVAPRVHALAASALFALGCLTLAPREPGEDLRAWARGVLAAESAGELQSCFTVHAAALALRDEILPSPIPSE